jgi:PAS domain S-box-containing protein
VTCLADLGDANVDNSTDTGLNAPATPSSREGDAPHPLLSVLEALPTPAVISSIEDGAILWVNTADVEFIGALSADEIIGRSILDYLPPDQHRAAADDLAKMASATVADRLEPMSYSLVQACGCVVPVRVSSVPFDLDGVPAVLSIIDDVSGRESALEALCESEERFRTIIESAPFGMYLCRLEDDGRFVLAAANPAADHVLGFEHAPLIGLSLAEAFPGLAGSGIPEVFEKIAREGGSWHTDRMPYSYGEMDGVFDVDAFQTGHGLTAVTFDDVTASARTEEELLVYRQNLESLVEERTVELRRSNEELEQATKAKNAFLASMSHELRTPLNSIIGFSGILLQGIGGELTAEQTKQIEMVNRAGKQLLSLVGDVLDLSKIESGRIEIELAPLEVHKHIESLTETVRPMAEERGLSLKLDLDSAPASIETDRVKLEQVLLNLLSNAIKYTDAGSVCVRVRRLDGHVAYSVEDTGPGIAIEDQELIFEEFRQLHSMTTAKHPGTGLGLSISRRLAGLLRGTLTVDSEPGAGSTFTLTIPIRPAEDTAEPTR